jgi:hypothetical protein
MTDPRPFLPMMAAIKSRQTPIEIRQAALSGNPTTVNAGSPPATWAWTSIGRTSVP